MFVSAVTLPSRPLLGSLALLLALGAAPPAAADSPVDFELNLGVYNRFNLRDKDLEQNLEWDVSAARFATERYLEPDTDDVYYSLYARVGFELSVDPWFGLVFAADTGELRPIGRIPKSTSVTFDDGTAATLLTTEDDDPVTSNGQAIADEAEETFFLREFYVRLSAPRDAWFTAEIGRINAQVASGLIYDDYGLAARFNFDLEAAGSVPLDINAQVILPARGYDEGLSSPLAELRFDYIFSPLESVGVFGAFFFDGDNTFSRFLDPQLAEAAAADATRTDAFGLALLNSVESSGTLGWVGAHASQI